MTPPVTRNERRILGRACYRIRKLKNLTQAQVATNAGADEHGRPLLDHTTVAHTEKGRQPTEATMYLIANGLGVDIDEITYQAVVYVVEAPVEDVA